MFPVNILVGAITGPVLGRCWQHRPSTGPVPARNGMFQVAFYLSYDGACYKSDHNVILIATDYKDRILDNRAIQWNLNIMTTLLIACVTSIRIVVLQFSMNNSLDCYIIKH